MVGFFYLMMVPRVTLFSVKPNYVLVLMRMAFQWPTIPLKPITFYSTFYKEIFEPQATENQLSICCYLSLFKIPRENAFWLICFEIDIFQRNSNVGCGVHERTLLNRWIKTYQNTVVQIRHLTFKVCFVFCSFAR